MDRRPRRFHLVAEASTTPYRAPAAGGPVGGACAVADRRLVEARSERKTIIIARQLLTRVLRLSAAL